MLGPVDVISPRVVLAGGRDASHSSFGYCSRSLVRTPFVIDLSIPALKNIRIRERYGVRFRSEALNFMIHPSCPPPVML